VTPDEMLELRQLLLGVRRDRFLKRRATECEGKQAWPSMGEADRSIRRKAWREGVRSYKCVCCHQWHIGGGSLRGRKPQGKPKARLRSLPYE
jgi:hypothetical protein